MCLRLKKENNKKHVYRYSYLFTCFYRFVITAFMLCGKLTSITYNGTKVKFLSIVDKEFIGPLHKKIEIICSDETFKL